MENIGGVVLGGLILAYATPAIIASYRKHPNATGITLLNLFLGWTFLGWVAALVWSVSAISAPVVIVRENVTALRYTEETTSGYQPAPVASAVSYQPETPAPRKGLGKVDIIGLAFLLALAALAFLGRF